MSTYIIREAIPADGEQIVGYMRTIADEPNNGITFSSADEFTYTVEDERRMLADFLHSDDKLFLVAEAENVIIGVANVSCGQRVEQYTASLGVTVRREWRGRGIGTALMQQLVTWATDHPQVRRLQLRVFANNAPAIHIYDKLGFQREGLQRMAAYKDDAWLDMVMMAIVFDDKLITTDN